MLPRRSAPAPPGPLPSSSPSSSYADASELDKYKLVSNIGKGSFGVISKVQRIEDGREFALKQLDYGKMTDKDRKQILAEVAILESLKHRNIVQLIQKIKDPKNERIYIIMEYCTSGDLGTLIRKAQRSNTPLNEDKIWNIFLQIVQALHHCHWPDERQGSGTTTAGRGVLGRGGDKDKDARYQVMHRDLKPENVFLSDDFVKLGDFGLSKDMGTAAFTSTYVGTPLYMPPEILAEHKYDTKSDIWSLGCLVYEMCALTSPFSTATTQTELISLVRSGKIPAIPAQYSATLRGVVRAMLTLDPKKRPTTQDLLDLEEMKLHRKLFSVQNQTQLLVTKKDELRRQEEHLLQRQSQLNDREEHIRRFEVEMVEREEACRVKEDAADALQKRLNLAAETLRSQWEKFREEKASLPIIQEQQMIRRPSMPPIRPPMEERATMPLPSQSRPPRPQHTFSYDDTPSKIPIPIHSSPSSFFSTGLTARQPNTLRRNASKSLGNLAARAQAEAALAAAKGEATPAKQVIRGHVPGRSSIGSPDDLQRVYKVTTGEYGWSEDVSMASPMPGSPFPLTGRRKSAGTTTGIRPSGSSSSQESISSAGESGGIYPTTSQFQAYGNQIQNQNQPTPMAKWTLDDPDLPSPFLRRMPTAPPSFPIQIQRNPLGAINLPQPATTTAGGGGMGAGGVGQKKGSSTTGIPRSRSGNLHQHVLKHNAAQAQQGEKRQVDGKGSTRPGIVGR